MQRKTCLKHITHTELQTQDVVSDLRTAKASNSSSIGNEWRGTF